MNRLNRRRGPAYNFRGPLLQRVKILFTPFFLQSDSGRLCGTLASKELSKIAKRETLKGSDYHLFCYLIFIKVCQMIPVFRLTFHIPAFLAGPAFLLSGMVFVICSNIPMPNAYMCIM